MRENTLVCYIKGTSFYKQGNSGYGVFGYVYSEVPKASSTGYPAKTDYKFTSKGILRKAKCPKEEIKPLNVIDIIGTSKSQTSNSSRATLKALSDTLKYVLKNETIKQVTIICELKYVVDGFINALSKLALNNWKTSSGSIVANKDLWSEIYDTRVALSDVHVLVNIQHVPRVPNTKANEKKVAEEVGPQVVDMYAALAANVASHKQTSEEEFYEIYNQETEMTAYRKEYDKSHMAFDYKWAIYGTKPKADDDSLFLCSPKDEEDVGKRTLLNTYAYIDNDVPEFLNNIKDEYRKVVRLYDRVFRINIEVIKGNKTLIRLAKMVPSTYLHYREITAENDCFMLFDKSGAFVEDMEHKYSFLLETIKHGKALERAIELIKNKPEDDYLINLNERFLNPNGKDLMITYQEKLVDLSGILVTPDYKFISRTILTIGKDTPVHGAMRELRPDIKNIYIHIDVKSVGNLASLVFVIEYEVEGKRAFFAQTNLLGRFLIRAK